MKPETFGLQGGGAAANDIRSQLDGPPVALFGETASRLSLAVRYFLEMSYQRLDRRTMTVIIHSR